jgi:hypothetical protein
MNETIIENLPAVVPNRAAYKNNWGREQRRRFVLANGFSTMANYGCGGNRLAVLIRDNYQCVQCEMTDAQHKERWGRPITIDHRDKNRRNNCLDNLQTLCLCCHGRKDILQRLVEARVFRFKGQILAMRRGGSTLQSIADATGFSIGAVWNWLRRWEAQS